MLLLLLGSFDGFIELPDVTHLYDPYKVYMASKTIIGDPKDPSDVMDYRIDWSKMLGDDTITSSLWNVPDGIAGDSGSNTSTTSTIWVSGGTAGQDYYVVNRIFTADGRSFERFLVIPVRNL